MLRDNNFKQVIELRDIKSTAICCQNNQNHARSLTSLRNCAHLLMLIIIGIEKLEIN
jgi:hypothetical protein